VSPQVGAGVLLLAMILIAFWPIASSTIRPGGKKPVETPDNTSTAAPPAPADAKSDSLTLTSQVLGAALVGEASKRYDEMRREAVYHDIQRLMAGRDDSLRLQRHHAAAAAWFTKKIDAIHAGEFKFDEITGVLLFNDPDLQRANY
jgi:hypothetical protein